MAGRTGSRIARRVKDHARVVRRDVGNLVRYGSQAPKYAERIWVDPRACARAQRFVRSQSAQVIGGDWDVTAYAVEDVDHVRFCLLHWEHGVPWEETGALDSMARSLESTGNSLHAPSVLETAASRYEQLDELFEQVRHEGRLRTRDELPGKSFRESGGILIHVSRDGRPIFGSGCHRFSIARVLDLPVVPAQVGVVHPDALPRWRTLFHAGEPQLPKT